jgi:hypothetical protein
MNKDKDLETILSITLGFVGLYLLFGKADVLLLLAFGIGIIGLFSNYLRKKIVLFWLKLGHILGTINGTILLSITFFVILFPIALLARAFGKSSFTLKPTSNETCYFERNHLYTSADFENTW